MRKILVCQHVAHELLGTLNPLFKSHGFRIRYVNFGRDPLAHPSLKGYYGLVLLGGPMHVYQIDRYPHFAYEMELIQTAIAKELPVLGICLGAQLMARALGAQVRVGLNSEIGWYDLHLTKEGKQDPLLTHFESCEKIFQWHEDIFTLPQGAVHLAASADCEIQAFRFGSKAYGFQFHLEVDEKMVHRWLKIAGIASEPIIQNTKTYIQRTHTLAHHCFSAFIKLFGVEKKFRLLKSR